MNGSRQTHREISLSLDQYSRLEKLHLHFNLPEQAIICTLCGYALAADDDRVGRHLGEKHHISKSARRQLNALVNSLKLPSPDTLPKRPDGSTPHPHLRIQDGKACKHCGLRSTSSDVLSKHIRVLHKPELAATRSGGKHWLRDHINDNLSLQSWTLNDIKRAWVVTAPVRAGASRSRSGNKPLQPAPDSIHCFANQLLDEERKRLGLQSTSIELPAGGVIAPSQALLTNWMRRTGWERTFERADCPMLISLSALPTTTLSGTANYLGIHNGQKFSSPAADEYRVSSITTALDRLFDQCGETVRFTDVSVRRWLRGRLPDRPYKAPFELVSQARSERVYRNEFKHCVSFWLRVWRLPPTVSQSILGRPLSRSQRMMLEELWFDSCWDETNDGVDDTEDITVDTEEEDEDSELEDEIMSGFSEYASTASEASETENLSDEESDPGSQRAGTSSPQVSGEDRNYTTSHISNSRETYNSCDRSVDAVLRFCYQMATEDFEDGMSSSTLLVYFSAVRGLSSQEGSGYLRPARYTPILSRLIYGTRLIFLEAILPRRAHPHAGFAARPRYGQLAALNAIRVNHMCDGTLSPLGEFFSLLAWTTRVFTEELKRLSRDVLGTDLEIDVQLYRQLSIAITERHRKAEDALQDVETSTATENQMLRDLEDVYNKYPGDKELLIFLEKRKKTSDEHQEVYTIVKSQLDKSSDRLSKTESELALVTGRLSQLEAERTEVMKEKEGVDKAAKQLVVMSRFLEPGWQATLDMLEQVSGMTLCELPSLWGFHCCE
ncbi:hypothetical protein HZS61_008082 [Fusarium oxysporum f. sp. conglutinans]|uniref:Uncharacterized protein n=2 Tax=Fusarium oxysporum f. sp. conglutinans TaxID=100902 RepID=A0A8H6LR70_FUSOX|nr:hypothetical protein HZS61_008082 [Fusarium oxysporum f. sp. conglutinans]